MQYSSRVTNRVPVKEDCPNHLGVRPNAGETYTDMKMDPPNDHTYLQHHNTNNFHIKQYAHIPKAEITPFNQPEIYATPLH